MRVLSLLLVLLVGLILVDAVASTSVPAKPTFALPFKLSYNAFIPEEGSSNQVEELTNSDGSKMYKNIATARGYYNSLVRNDLLPKDNLFYYYDIDGKTVCYAFNTKQPYPVPLPNFENVQFSMQTLIEGRLVNLWSLNFGNRKITVRTDAETGAPVGGDDKEIMMGHNSVFAFANGTSLTPPPDDSNFEIPEACSTPENGGSSSSHFSFPKEVSPEDNMFYLSKLAYLIEKQQHHQHEKKKQNNQPLSQLSSSSSSSSSKTKYHSLLTPRAQQLLRESNDKHKSLSVLAWEMAAPEHRLPDNHFGNDRSTLRRIPNLNIDNSIYCSPVRNQGICGSCHSFSSANIANLYFNKRLGMNTTITGYQGIPRNYLLSVQSLLDCAHGDLNGTALIADKGCFGGWPLVDMLQIVKNGIPPEDSYPYDGANGRQCLLPSIPKSDVVFPFKNAFLIAKKNESDDIVPLLEQALIKYGAFVAIINILPDFLTFSQGVYDNSKCVPGLAHAVAVVGVSTDPETNSQSWLVLNSFGRGWGDQEKAGYFRMKKGVNMCGIEDFGYIAEPQ